MYYFHKWPILMREKFTENSFIIFSSDRNLIAIVTSNEIFIYHTKSKLLNTVYSRSKESMQQYGNNVCGLWKSDGASIALGTELGFVILLTIEFDDSTIARECFNTILNVTNSQQTITSASAAQRAPAFIIRLYDVVNFEAGITSMDNYYDDIIISSTNGCIYRMDWNGKPLYSQTIRLDRVLFYYDLEHSKAARIEETDIFCQQLEWIITFQGILILLTNGKAALLCLSSGRLDVGLLGRQQIEGVWATHLKYATCMAGNQRYRLVAFGGRNGEGALYSIDEMTGSLVLVQRLKISAKEYPDAQHVTGAVCAMRWSPDCSCLVMVWEHCGFSLWSTFGSLLFSTLGERVAICRQMTIYDVAWGAEGYSLWLLSEEWKYGSSSTSESPFPRDVNPPHHHHYNYHHHHESNKSLSLLVHNLIHTCLTTSLTVYNHNHILLLSSDMLFISTRRDIVDGKSIQGVAYPDDYVRYFWPIKYAAVDELGERVAIAGSHGFTHCSLHLRKWKLFGNETQERDLEVFGGLTWWKDHIFMACYSHILKKFLLRAYPSTQKLDNNNCTEVQVDTVILQINSFRNTLLTLSGKATVSLYEISPSKVKSQIDKLDVEKRQVIDISYCIPFPICIIAISLTGLRSEIVRKDLEKQKSEAESILINYAGRVLMFQRDRSGKLLQGNTEPFGFRKAAAQMHRKNPLPFCSPIVVASSVELMWCTPFSSLAVTAASMIHNQSSTQRNASPSHSQQQQDQQHRHLTDTLWLNCGAHGMRVWLPLLSRDSRTPGFMSRRIMLPFLIETYPLAVLVEEALFVGIVNDFSQPMGYSSRLTRSLSSTSNDNSSPNGSSPSVPMAMTFPYAQIEKHSEIYLHQVIKQLLRKNLGVNALELSLCCRHLNYFPHVLELLLHEVLEEEATSKEPIPDPLLPRVVAFIQEFVEFLDTVAHCARKTEVALWPHLFAIVGQPKELFENCLVSGELETAASYLIILQNMEKPIMSKQHALLLLSSSLEKRKWKLVEDLIRFLQAIDPRDMADFNAELGRPSEINYGGGVHEQLNNFVSPGLYRWPTSVASVPLTAKKWPSLLHSLNNTSPTSPLAISVPDEVFHMESNFSNNPQEDNDLIADDNDSSSQALSSSMGTSGLRSTAMAPPSTLPPRHNSTAGIPTTLSAPPARKDRIDLYSLTDELTRILHNHARHLLANYRVYELAEFASNTPFHDKQFISWLTKEADKAGAAKNYPQALQRLHEDFHWPFPLIFRSSSFTRFTTSGSDSTDLLRKQRLSSSKFKKMQGSSSLYGDGGASTCLRSSSDVNETNVLLSSLPKSKQSHDDAFTWSMSNESLNGNVANHSKEMDMTYRYELEKMSHELANRGSEKSLVQLRYLHRVFTEAQCWDWCILIGIVLRDPLSITRDLARIGLTTPLARKDVVTLSNNNDSPTTVGHQQQQQQQHRRIQLGLWQLYDWASQNCTAYLRLFEPVLLVKDEAPTTTTTTTATVTPTSTVAVPVALTATVGPAQLSAEVADVQKVEDKHSGKEVVKSCASETSSKTAPAATSTTTTAGTAAATTTTTVNNMPSNGSVVESIPSPTSDDHHISQVLASDVRSSLAQRSVKSQFHQHQHPQYHHQYLHSAENSSQLLHDVLISPHDEIQSSPTESSSTCTLS